MKTNQNVLKLSIYNVFKELLEIDKDEYKNMYEVSQRDKGNV